MLIRSAVAAAVVAGGIVLPASAESVQVKIADNAPYEQSLVCYQFHSVSGQIMQAASQSGEVQGEQKQRLEMMSGFAGFLQAHWREHIETVKGDRSTEQVNTDLQQKTAHVIEDAQAGLSGDTAARTRQQEVEKSCLEYEERTVIEDPA